MKVVFCAGLFPSVIEEAVAQQYAGEHELIMLVRQGDIRAKDGKNCVEVAADGVPLTPIAMGREDICVLNFIRETPIETVWAIAHLSMARLQCRVIYLDTHWRPGIQEPCRTMEMARLISES